VCQCVLQGLPLEKVEHTNICNKSIVITVLVLSEKHLEIMGITVYIFDEMID
jgi:hypothetical protein